MGAAVMSQSIFLQAKTVLYREAWRQFRDIQKSNLTVGPQPGDLRAAMAPFIAAKAAGPENFKWMMFGDDDTVFFVDNVLQVCAQQLDWQGCCCDLCSYIEVDFATTTSP